MNMHVVPARSYSADLAEHYAAVRLRLRAPEYVPTVSLAPVLLLPAPEWSLPQFAADIVPNQRGKVFMPIGAEAEIVAARRALTIFARLREESPQINSVRHVQVAVAEAFKIDLWVMLGRSKRHGPSRVRQIAMTLAKRVCHVSRSQIAIRFDRNHATVHFAEKKFAAFLDGATSQIGGVR